MTKINLLCMNVFFFTTSRVSGLASIVTAIKFSQLETCVSSTITNHLTDHQLSHPHQWAYKKGHSKELLLVKMTEQWRWALDNNLVVGVVLDISSSSGKKTTRVRCIRQSLVVDKELSLKSPSSNSDQWPYMEVIAC